MPYFTDKDTALVRSLGTRDPLGFLPVWSAFARQLVPNVASPVVQVDGIKAVLLIFWLGEDTRLRMHCSGAPIPGGNSFA